MERFPFPARFISILRMFAKPAPNSKEVIDENLLTINDRRSNTDCLPLTRSVQKIRLESKWNATLLVHRKIFDSSGTYEKEVLFFRAEYFKREFLFHFLKVIFDTSFGPLRPLLGE